MRIGTDNWNWHKQNWCLLNTDKFNSIFTIEHILHHIQVKKIWKWHLRSMSKMHYFCQNSCTYAMESLPFETILGLHHISNFSGLWTASGCLIPGFGYWGTYSNSTEGELKHEAFCVIKKPKTLGQWTPVVLHTRKNSSLYPRKTRCLWTDLDSFSEHPDPTWYVHRLIVNLCLLLLIFIFINIQYLACGERAGFMFLNVALIDPCLSGKIHSSSYKSETPKTCVNWNKTWLNAVFCSNTA